jgi:hypothetical protein
MWRRGRFSGDASTMTRRESLHSHPALSTHQLRLVAVEATCDPRGVVKYLRGRSMRSMLQTRIEKALAACGFGHLVRATAPSSPGLASAPPPSSRPEAQLPRIKAAR